MPEENSQFAKLMMGFTQQAMTTERKQVQFELSKAEARDRELDTLFEKLYEDNVAGKISDERFARMSKKYEDEQADLRNSIKTLQADIERIDGKAATADMFKPLTLVLTILTTPLPYGHRLPVVFHRMPVNSSPKAIRLLTLWKIWLQSRKPAPLTITFFVS